jgi:uncharacterized membrane protein YagU involved in acid resistance
MNESRTMAHNTEGRPMDGQLAVDQTSKDATARSAAAAALLGGLVAGTLDIVVASVINLRNPLVILAVIASGLIGKAAFQARADVVVLGLVLQWAMSIAIAAIFVFGTRRVPLARRRWVAGGLVYGVIVFLVMNYIVVPISAVPQLPGFTVAKFLENLAAMLLFGLIIAFYARRTR